MKRSLACVAFVTVLFISPGCSKKSSTTTPVDYPAIIQIDNPTGAVVYTNGFPLAVNGTITDNNTVTTAKLEIKNTSTGAILYQETTSAGNIALYRFNWSWTVTGITASTPATVKVTATDYYNNVATREVNITLNN